jgi:hypothetical protein
MTTIFLLSFQVIAFVLNAPLLAYNVNKSRQAFSLFLLKGHEKLTGSFRACVLLQSRES